MSKVLLLCVSPNDSWNSSISEELLRNFFSQFGQVKDTYIFDKNVQVKAFIEFENQLSAEKTLQSCPKGKAFFGTFKAHLSTKKSIIRPSKKMAKTIQNTCYNYSLPPLTSDSAKQDSFVQEGFLIKSIINSFKESNCQNQTEQQSQNFQKHQNLCKWDFSIVKDAHVQTPFSNSPTLDDLNRKSVFGSNLSKVLILNRITPKVLMNHIRRIFNCYGNLHKILINRESNYALIEFQTKEQSESAYFYLKNLIFFETSLKIKRSKYKSLDFKSSNEPTRQNVEHLIINPSEYPNKHTVLIRNNSPTNKVLFINCPKGLNSILLQDILHQIHPTTRVENSSHLTNHKLSFIAIFKTQTEATEIIAIFDEQKINDKSIKAVFTS